MLCVIAVVSCEFPAQFLHDIPRFVVGYHSVSALLTDAVCGIAFMRTVAGGTAGIVLKAGVTVMVCSAVEIGKIMVFAFRQFTADRTVELFRDTFF